MTGKVTSPNAPRRRASCISDQDLTIANHTLCDPRLPRAGESSLAFLPGRIAKAELGSQGQAHWAAVCRGFSPLGNGVQIGEISTQRAASVN